MAEKDTRAPFYLAAKERLVDDRLYNGGKLKPFEPETTSNLQLRKVGLTMALLVRVRVKATLGAGTPVLNEEGLYSLIKRIQVVIGNQQAQPIDLTASGLRSEQRTSGHYGFAGYDTPAMGKIVPNPKYWNAPVVAGQANDWVMTFLVPFSANLHKDRHLGILPTSSKGFTANLVIDWEKTSNIISGVTCAFSDSKIEVQAYTLDTPNFSKVKEPAFFIISRKSNREGGVLAGDNSVEILQGGRLMAVGGILRVNGARSNDIESINLRLNGSNMPRDQRLWQNHADFRRKTGIDLPDGEFMLNFMDSTNEHFSGWLRDTINTGETGLTEVVINVNASNLSVNPSANTIEIIRSTMHAINVSPVVEESE